jgi:hypothetical protein
VNGCHRATGQVWARRRPALTGGSRRTAATGGGADTADFFTPRYDGTAFDSTP